MKTRGQCEEECSRQRDDHEAEEWGMRSERW